MARGRFSSGKIHRYGFLLASIHTGSSNTLWASVADAAQQAQAALFVFPGGRLEASSEFEYLRNSIYRLASRDNLDGIICWGSSLGGTVSVDDVKRYLASLSDLPMVTIALKSEGIPNIGFDAYQGMRSLVLHCIDVHQSQTIAFLRGPLNHASAEERFAAYRDALSERNIPYDERLVSDPTSWHEGESSLRTLIEANQLVPGRDFDTLICASDLLMLHAARVLEKSGYKIPDDVRVAGFNDSPESRFLSSAGTTVRVPFPAMGSQAFSMIQRLVEHKESVADHLEPASLVIRNSCGCTAVHPQSSKDTTTVMNKAALIEWLGKAIELTRFQKEAWIDPLVESLYRNADDPNFSEFDDILHRVLQRILERQYEPNVFDRLIDSIEKLDDLPYEYRKHIGAHIRKTAFGIQARISDSRSYETVKRSQILSSFKCDLLCATDRHSISGIMHTHLPQLGIRQAFIVMTEDDLYSRFIGGYGNDGPLEEVDQLFPATSMLPDSLIRLCHGGVHLVQPLFIENQPLGYLITSISDRDGNMHEDLRSSIASALKGILLFEETVRAKEVAERAEQAKMEFFATMGDGLKHPLLAVLEKTRSLEDEVRKIELPGNKELSHAIGTLGKELESHLSAISLLFDTTLAQAGILEMNMRLIDATAFFDECSEQLKIPVRKVGKLPMFCVDERRLKQVFAILVDSLRAFQPVEICVTIEVHALVSEIRSTTDRLNVEVPGGAVQLAASLVLLHHGTLRRHAGAYRIELPWPSIGSRISTLTERGSKIIGHITSRSDARCNESIVELAERTGYQVRSVPADRIIAGEDSLDDCDVLYWDIPEASLDQFVAMKKLSRHGLVYRIPILGFGDGMAHVDIMDLVNSKTIGRNSSSVIFWNLPLSEYDMLSATVQAISIENKDQFVRVLQECRPSLIITSSTDGNQMSCIRSNEASALIPVLVLAEKLPEWRELEAFCAYPHVVLYHTGVVECDEFILKVQDLSQGGEVLPVHTGALVKRSLKYIEEHASTQVSRWRIAETVNVSEDYLTRIFKKELGLSPWEYLNRYRIHLACDLLVKTNLTLSEIALQTGFQDQAYFCRVFKKIRGCTPSELRTD